jgi:RNA polymerase sigma-70 factor, ECF subfamily
MLLAMPAPAPPLDDAPSTAPPAAPRRPAAGGADLDDVTLRRAQRGDAAAFRLLIERYQRQVHALLWRMLAGRGSRDRVEDLVQETFLRVHRALPGFDPAGPARLGSWILTIATRQALNDLRARARAAVHGEELAELAPAASDGPAEVARRRLGQALEKAIAGLSDEARAVVVLREYHDLDYDEIAAALGLEIGTVKSRLSRARAELRRSLEAFRGE